jgi:hypothetical protein
MWLLLLMLTKMAPVETVGVYAVCQALGLPIWMLLSLKLGFVQVTDAKNDFDFGHYFALRMMTAILTPLLVATIAYSLYPLRTALVATLLGCGYGVMTLRGVFLAVMQKSERMDRMAASRIAQGLLSLMLFGAFFWFTRSLAFGISGLIIARLVVLFIHDIPVSRKLLREEGNSPSASVMEFRPAFCHESVD